jgi:hypothetical protein
MDNLLEILVPLIFAAIYFFGNMFSKKSEDEDVPAAPSHRRTEEDPEAIERQRRIQAEIRRKIEERRHQEGAGRAPAPQASPSLGRSAQPSASPAERRTFAEVRPASTAGTYETQMQERLRQIEATRRQAEKLQKQAGAARSKAAPSDPVMAHAIDDRIGRSDLSTEGRRSAHSRQRCSGRQSVRNTLRDPAAARIAFIHSEVLGVPVSQRKSSSVPGLLR